MKNKENQKSGLVHLDLGESFEILTGHGGVKKLFLKRFTKDELWRMSEKIGLVSHLNKKGFDKLILDIDVDDTRINYFNLYMKEKRPENRLLDVRLSETLFLPDKKFFKEGSTVTPYEMINIEWISARNPYMNFSSDRPQLPGQESPGLGILKYCFRMIYLMASEIVKDGFMDVPDHMHGAIMYSPDFKFFDPVHEAILRAVMRDLKKYSISDISWGIITSTVIEKYSGRPQVYDPCEQVHSVSRSMGKYFRSDLYRDTFKKYYNRKKYYLDYPEMKRRREDILFKKRTENL